LIELAEQKASCELYAILKRDDEKVVTERAYDNPAFVEDLVRDIAVADSVFFTSCLLIYTIGGVIDSALVMRILLIFCSIFFVGEI
jgi:hypothetical protein